MGRLTTGVLAGAAAVLAVAAAVQPVQASQVSRTAGAAQERPPLPDTTDAAFNDECLAVHNSYRARHGARPLVLDRAAVAHAVRRAQLASTRDGLDLPPGSEDFGENRYWAPSYEEMPRSCEEAVRYWYKTRFSGGYDWNKPGFSPRTGSFTQLVWKSSSTLGCGRAAGRPVGAESYQTYIICSYGPPGNVVGGFRENVGAPVGEG
ncbi:CAP family protein [Streptomyces sp. NPDC004111]|uniref:CAP family protein n=1 Tax=Streptomyces sp. NPDC004111 TaxID=3364690 RepID=UPI0036A591FB